MVVGVVGGRWKSKVEILRSTHHFLVLSTRNPSLPIIQSLDSYFDRQLKITNKNYNNLLWLQIH